MSPERPVVLKFGGAALRDLDAVTRRIEEARKEGLPLVVVASARKGVTDRLEAILAHPRDRRLHARVRAAIERLHPGPSIGVGLELHRLSQLVRAIERRGAPDGPLADRLLSLGERLAVHWLSGELLARGLPATPVEADHLGLITDNVHGASVIDFKRSGATVRAGLHRRLRAGRIPVVTGFIGRSTEGRVTTLGRGGSDYTASALGAILGARRVELVKSEVSVLTADPKFVPRARAIPRLSYEEAEELAQFGARVLHPLTIEPARRAGVELWVRSLHEPERMTVIGAARAPPGVRALTLIPRLRLLRLRVPGGRQRRGVVAELSTRLADAGINLVTLFTSSALLTIIVERERGAASRKALLPMTAGGATVLEGPFPVSLVTAIGDGLLGGFSRWPQEVMGRAEGFSATPRSLSLAVPNGQGRLALSILHEILVERATR